MYTHIYIHVDTPQETHIHPSGYPPTYIFIYTYTGVYRHERAHV